MVSRARIFFAGVGTTFVILGAGFGGGLFMANSALKEPTHQARAAEPPSPVRVILPTSAEDAQPTPPLQQVAAVEPSPAPSSEPLKAAPPEKRVEKVDTRKAEIEVRERRKRYAERKARRQAEKAKREQQIEQAERQEPPIMAFGGDERRQNSGFGFFGN